MKRSHNLTKILLPYTKKKLWVALSPDRKKVGDRVPFGILGRENFFDLFKVCIDHKNEEVELKPYK